MHVQLKINKINKTSGLQTYFSLSEAKCCLVTGIVSDQSWLSFISYLQLMMVSRKFGASLA